jgi:hypothetical protein
MYKENIKSVDRKRKHGEVLTPCFLVNEMLDKIPESVWKNPKLKWIDNSCGTGNFLIEIKNRLLKYHAEQHILQNMIYGVDIQEDNIKETKQKLGDTNNIVCFNSLTFDYWNNMKFDVIVGNPPYNNDKGDKKGNTCNPLWNLFVEHAITKLLNDNGLLLFVHPPLWRKPEHKLWKLMKKYQLHFLKIYSTEESSKMFNCSTKVDYYLLQKKDAYKDTIIIDEKGIKSKITVHDKPFIPNFYIEEVYNVFSGKTDVIYDCSYHHYTQQHVKSEKNEEYNLPCIYLVNKKGIKYYYSNKNIGHFGIHKVIIPMGSYIPILDETGQYGMCEVAFAIPIKDKEYGESLMKFLTSDNFRRILSACKWKTVQLDYRLFKYLNIP